MSRGADFKISSRCTGGGCVGVAADAEGVILVDTKDAGGARLRFSRDEWNAFVEGVKLGEFDVC